MALNGPPQSPRSLSNAASALRRSAAIRQDLSKPVATQTNDGLPTDYGTNSSRGSGRMSAASMHKTASGGGDTVSSQDSTPWTEARTRTQTGSSIGSQDLTPRQYSGPGRVLQERHGSFENVKGAPLHQPPVLMPRLPIGASYQHDYTSSLSPRGTRQQSRDGNIVETDYRSDVEALDARAEIERDEDDDSSDSHGWSGVEDNYTSTPMKSPLLTQMLGNITPNQAFTPAFSSDNATRANDSTRFESDLTTPGPDTHTFINSDSGTLARVVAADQHAVPASHTPTHSTVAHEKNQHQDIGPAAPTSLSTSTPSGPMSPSQVGKALDWDEKASCAFSLPVPAEVLLIDIGFPQHGLLLRRSQPTRLVDPRSVLHHRAALRMALVRQIVRRRCATRGRIPHLLQMLSSRSLSSLIKTSAGIHPAFQLQICRTPPTHSHQLSRLCKGHHRPPQVAKVARKSPTHHPIVWHPHRFHLPEQGNLLLPCLLDVHVTTCHHHHRKAPNEPVDY